MSKIDIKPNQKPYNSLSRFKFFALTNFPFIDADFDALTSYEILCKIVEYLNGVIENEQVVTENVQSLYNAFIALESAINDELEAQDQKIDDYFTNTNIQAFVDNKINEMIATNEFQALIIEAIEEINPSVLNLNTRVNVEEFDESILTVGLNQVNYNASFLNSNNKNILLDIINNMRTNNAKRYYFVSSPDALIPLFSLRQTNASFTSIIIKPYYDLTSLSLNITDTYTDYLTFNLTYTDDVVTDITYASETTKTYQFLKNGNTNAYTPTNDYDPATKKFVLDNAGGGANVPLYTFKPQSIGTMILFKQYGGINFDGSDFDAFADILNDAHANNFDKFIIMYYPTSGLPELILVNISGINFTQSSGNVTMSEVLTTSNYGDMLIYGSNNTGGNYATLGFSCSIVNGLITSFNYQISSLSYNRTFVPAEKTMAVDCSIDVAPAGFYGINEDIILMKQGNVINLHGTMKADVGVSWSTAIISLPEEYAPMPFVAGSGYTACMGTAILILASDNSYHTIEYHYVHSADASDGHFAFSPLSAQAISVDDVIRFNITYIKQ